MFCSPVLSLEYSCFYLSHSARTAGGTREQTVRQARPDPPRLSPHSARLAPSRSRTASSSWRGERGGVSSKKVPPQTCNCYHRVGTAATLTSGVVGPAAGLSVCPVKRDTGEADRTSSPFTITCTTCRCPQYPQCLGYCLSGPLSSSATDKINGHCMDSNPDLSVTGLKVSSH
ncbi:hypothetical protein ElyMa_003447900 [Elysia marginata]|uniref:Uncharacterized protein n=1 Tax=Elysia marginata TaxID=1093978 RepID=A0AAV4JXP4_9GAST|nr:hypothetical protein ElyMa_003447900 [Elysia marginata]